MKPSTLSIGQLARASGVSVQGLRFYERRGLLATPARTPSGHRRYPVEITSLIALIKRAQALGFTLAEIAGMVGLRQDPDAQCRDLCRIVRAKLDHVERQLDQLRAVRDRLIQLRDSCPRVRPLRDCPIFAELEAPSGRKQRSAS